MGAAVGWLMTNFRTFTDQSWLFLTPHPKGGSEMYGNLPRGRLVRGGMRGGREPGDQPGTTMKLAEAPGVESQESTKEE